MFIVALYSVPLSGFCSITVGVTSVICGLFTIGGQQPDHGVELRVDRGKGGGSFDMFQLLEYMECVCRIENSHR